VPKTLRFLLFKKSAESSRIKSFVHFLESGGLSGQRPDSSIAMDETPFSEKRPERGEFSAEQKRGESLQVRDSP
jgi:hypothetical protein